MSAVRLSAWLCVVVLCVAAALPRAWSQVSCDPCVSGGAACSGLDLTGIGSQDFTATSGSNQYDIQLCQDISACSGRACKHEQYEADNLGSGPQWTLQSPADATRGASFVTTAPGTDYYDSCDTTQSTVHVLCGAKGDDSVTVNAEGATNNCQWEFTIDSAYVCSLQKAAASTGGSGGGSSGGSSKSGLSGGSIFVILFFVAVTVYLVAGVLFNRYRRGLTGIDLIPNVGFWRDLPGLVRDGCVFSFQKTRALCGGARTGSLLSSKSSGSTYETI